MEALIADDRNWHAAAGHGSHLDPIGLYQANIQRSRFDGLQHNGGPTRFSNEP
jgi:hypothetical protein